MASSLAPDSAAGYRPEIDGLRAVAVVAVVVFHAQLGCPGGYVGVDVFFVISGFLITSLLVRSLDKGTFRLADFWERRIRRIAPAAFVAVAATLAGAWFLYLPEDFERLGQALAAQALCVANVFHWRIAGYFSPDAEALPLLHTWSLAVEEQFYFVLPLGLALIARFRRSWLAPAIAVSIALSLAMSIVATPIRPAASFYLLPTRAWELLLGSLLGACPNWGAGWSRAVREGLSVAGLSAIALAMAAFHANTPMPGYAALLPCLGTAALIAANSTLTVTGRALAAPPMVFVGQLSYSYYLYHWPVLVLALYWFADEIDLMGRVGLVAAATGLAILSWALVERPVRHKRLLASRRSLFIAAAAATLAMLGVALAIVLAQGFPSRFDSQTLAYANAAHSGPVWKQLEPQDPAHGRLLEIGAPPSADRPPVCLVWGDSHATAIVEAVHQALLARGQSGVASIRASTAPLLEFVSPELDSLRESSPAFNQAVVDEARRRGVNTVILAAYWSRIARDPSFARALESTVRQLVAAGLEVVLVRDVPSQPGNVPRLLARASHWGRDPTGVGVMLDEHRAANRLPDQIFVRLAGPHVRVVDPAPLLTDASGRCRGEFSGVAMYYDLHHLTQAGAERLKPLFEKLPALAD